MAVGRFDTGRFTPDLFSTLEIARPDSLHKAVDKRLADFLAGRCMARLAMERLGVIGEVEPGADRLPVWPSGLAGSISHARGHCASLVMPADCGDPGIDIEALATGKSLEAILSTTMNADEVALTDGSGVIATACFSAKETLFKALYPTVRRFFGFSAARFVGFPEDGLIRLELTETLHPTLPEGRLFDIFHDDSADHVMTWMVHKTG